MLGNNDVLIIVFSISFFIRLNTITFSIKLSAYIIVPDLLQHPGNFPVGRGKWVGKYEKSNKENTSHLPTQKHILIVFSN